ncbi:hypothetical protein KI387_033215, partial [Taxus chinensis]
MKIWGFTKYLPEILFRVLKDDKNIRNCRIQRKPGYYFDWKGAATREAMKLTTLKPREERIVVELLKGKQDKENAAMKLATLKSREERIVVELLKGKQDKENARVSREKRWMEYASRALQRYHQDSLYRAFHDKISLHFSDLLVKDLEAIKSQTNFLCVVVVLTYSVRHESSRISETDLSNGEDIDDPDSYVHNYKAKILSLEHYEKCFAKFSSEFMAQIYVFFRYFDNEGIKSFNLTEIQGYWHQKMIKSIDFSDLQDYSKDELSDSFDLDEDVATGTRVNKHPRKNRSTQKLLGASDRVYGRKTGEKNKTISGNIYKETLDGEADGSLDNCISERRFFSLGVSEIRKKGGACEQQSMSFDIGEKIELLCQDSGIRCCWFSTIIKRSPHRIKEWVPSFRIALLDKLGMRLTGRPTIRPFPPKNSLGIFEVGTAVDACWNDGQWEGVVVMFKDLSNEFQVFFP